MYPVIPVEFVLGALQFVCYFFTVMALLFGLVLAR